MSPRENAAMPYRPDDEDLPVSNDARLNAAWVEAERLLSPRPWVTGIGLGRTPIGDDAIVVYLRNREDRRQLPRSIGGVPVVGEVTGDIEPLDQR